MSHVATVDVEVKDLESLDLACQRLGLELVRHQLSYKWFGKHIGDYPLPEGFAVHELGRCDHAIRIPGKPDAYEIGVVRRRDGRPGFMLLWDFFAGGYGLEKIVGHECQALRQHYAAAVATREARRKGFIVQETKLGNGQIQLRMTR